MTTAGARGRGHAPAPAWLAALTLVLAGHIALGLALHRPPAAPPAPEAPEAAIFVDLPPEEALPPAESVESIASAAAAEVEPAETEPVLGPPNPPEKAKLPELPPEPPRNSEPVLEAPVEPPPPVVAAKPVVPAPAEPLPPIVEETPVAPEVAEVFDPVPPDVRPPSKPKPEAAKPRLEPTKPKVAKAQPKRDVAERQQKAAPEAVAGEKASGAGRPNAEALAGYSAAVRKRIMRHRSEVAAGGARNRRVTVSFTVASDGRVSGVQVAASSGNAALDEAAVAMVRRADPLPAIPPEIGRSSLRLSLPVRFDG